MSAIGSDVRVVETDDGWIRYERARTPDAWVETTLSVEVCA